MEPAQNALAALLRDISTQLRSSLSTAQLAIDRLVPAAQREKDQKTDARAAVLDQSYYRLLRLSRDLSALSDLTAGIPPTLQDCSLTELVRDLCLRTEPFAALLGLEIRFHSEEDLPLCAVDWEKMECLLLHLISNACKYTPSGGSVVVELRRSKGRLLLSVQDTGCGIEPSRLADLFDRSARETPPPPRSGLGLGLPLCRAIAQAHEGRILAESRMGQGTRFTVSLPIRTCGTSTVSDVPSTYASGFNRTLMALADALPASAFQIGNQL